MKMKDMTPTTSRGSSSSSPLSGRRGRMIRPLPSQGPRMGTIKMVAAAIKEAKEYPSRYQLLRSLRKGMIYETLDEVLGYLESTNQIMIGKDGSIIWILADNPKLKKLLAQTKPF